MVLDVRDLDFGIKNLLSLEIRCLTTVEKVTGGVMLGTALYFASKIRYNPCLPHSDLQSAI